MNIRTNKVKQKLAAGETVYVVSGLFTNVTAWISDGAQEFMRRSK